MSERTHASRTNATSTSVPQPRAVPAARQPEAQGKTSASGNWSFAGTSLHPQVPGIAEPSSDLRSSSELWYFDGAHGNVSTPTRVTLATDADRSGEFVWSVREGAEKARLVHAEPTTGHVRRFNDNRVELESLGPSSGEDDVVVDATRMNTDGSPAETRSARLGVRSPATARQVSATTVRQHGAQAFPGPADSDVAGAGEAPDQQQEQQTQPEQAQAGPAVPHHLAAKGSSHAADATYGYLSHINYEVIDDKGKAIKGFDVNEQWETGVVKDDATCTWPRGGPGGFTSATTMFADMIGAVGAGGVPAPTAPGSPLGTHATQHWGQAWYIGSTTPGKGTKVQTNTLQKYLDHAEHTGIKSPP